jgi:hypothetical protein
MCLDIKHACNLVFKLLLAGVVTALLKLEETYSLYQKTLVGYSKSFSEQTLFEKHSKAIEVCSS